MTYSHLLIRGEPKRFDYEALEIIRDKIYQIEGARKIAKHQPYVLALNVPTFPAI